MHRPAPGEAALWHGFNDFTLRLGSCGKDNLAVYFPSRDAACDLQHVGISPAHTRSDFFGRVGFAHGLMQRPSFHTKKNQRRPPVSAAAKHRHRQNADAVIGLSTLWMIRFLVC
jgi:hypothetical protein